MIDDRIEGTHGPLIPKECEGPRHQRLTAVDFAVAHGEARSCSGLGLADQVLGDERDFVLTVLGMIGQGKVPAPLGSPIAILGKHLGRDLAGLRLDDGRSIGVGDFNPVSKIELLLIVVFDGLELRQAEREVDLLARTKFIIEGDGGPVFDLLHGGPFDDD